MDSIWMSVAVWGIHVKLYDLNLVTHGVLQCFVFSPAALYCILRDWGGLLCPLWAQESGVVWKWVMEVVGASRVVHSDPAATIKIGGVRCLHSYLCKSHQPEPFLFLAAGYIIIRLAGNCSG